MTNEIKEYGLSIGYQKIGIVSVDRMAGYAEEVISRGDKYDFFVKTLTRPIRDKMPEAKSIIVMILDYYTREFSESLCDMIGKIYLARCYDPQEGTLARSRYQMMKKFLEQKGCNVGVNIRVPERWAAAQAGVTTFGRNNFAYADGIGSYIVIHTLVVDKELEYDAPTMECKCPPNCRACINACPTKALYEPFRLDPRKCIPFNHWVTQDANKTVTSFIPYEIREKAGCKIHGCDICQDVCPRNQKKRKQMKEADAYIEKIAPDITLPALLHMNNEYYEHRIKPIMYNYIRDNRYFVRNAAIAMGNTKDERYVEDLKMELENPDAMIREYAAWALGKIGGSRAMCALEEHLKKETEERVIQEIHSAQKGIPSDTSEAPV